MFVRIFSVMVAASFIVAAGALGLMASERKAPFTILSIKVNQLRFRPGDELERTIRFIQHKRCFIHSGRAIIDSQNTRFLLDPIVYQAGWFGEVEQEEEIVLKISIPVDIAPGLARLEVSTLYRCNPLHWLWPIHSPYNPLFFEVVPL